MKKLIQIFLSLTLAMAILHVLFADLKVGGVYWFNLDKERNIATWFSGMLHFMTGCLAVATYYVESRGGTKTNLNKSNLSELWLVVATLFFFFSLDEITILHENIMWKEIRVLSVGLGDVWKYITQWQLLFFPAIVGVLIGFVAFFIDRFYRFIKSLQMSLAGLLCWGVSLGLEGIRGWLKMLGADWYQWGVVIEECLEMIGTGFILGAFLLYGCSLLGIEIMGAIKVNNETAPVIDRLSSWKPNRVMIMGVGITLTVIMLLSLSFYLLAEKQMDQGAKVPRLINRALRMR